MTPVHCVCDISNTSPLETPLLMRFRYACVAQLISSVLINNYTKPRNCRSSMSKNYTIRQEQIADHRARPIRLLGVLPSSCALQAVTDCPPGSKMLGHTPIFLWTLPQALGPGRYVAGFSTDEKSLAVPDTAATSAAANHSTLTAREDVYQHRKYQGPPQAFVNPSLLSVRVDPVVPPEIAVCATTPPRPVSIVQMLPPPRPSSILQMPPSDYPTTALPPRPTSAMQMPPELPAASAMQMPPPPRPTAMMYPPCQYSAQSQLYTPDNQRKRLLVSQNGPYTQARPLGGVVATQYDQLSDPRPLKARRSLQDLRIMTDARVVPLPLFSGPPQLNRAFAVLPIINKLRQSESRQPPPQLAHYRPLILPAVDMLLRLRLQYSRPSTTKTTTRHPRFTLTSPPTHPPYLDHHSPPRIHDTSQLPATSFALPEPDHTLAFPVRNSNPHYPIYWHPNLLAIFTTWLAHPQTQSHRIQLSRLTLKRYDDSRGGIATLLEYDRIRYDGLTCTRIRLPPAATLPQLVPRSRVPVPPMQAQSTQLDWLVFNVISKGLVGDGFLDEMDEEPECEEEIPFFVLAVPVVQITRWSVYPGMSGGGGGVTTRLLLGVLGRVPLVHGQGIRARFAEDWVMGCAVGVGVLEVENQQGVRLEAWG